MKALIVSTLAGVMLTSAGLARAEHNGECKGVHGRISAVTDEGVAVNGKFYKVGKSTRITKDEKVVKLSKLSTGDVVCVDTRGKDDLATGGEVASVFVLTSDDVPSNGEKEKVREKNEPANRPSLPENDQGSIESQDASREQRPVRELL